MPFETGHAGVQRQRHEVDPAVSQLLEDVGTEGAARRGHLRRPGRTRVDGLVRLDRPLAAHVRIADWPTEAGHHIGNIGIELRQPQAFGLRIPRQEPNPRTAREIKHLAFAGRNPPRLDNPQTGRQPRRDVQIDVRSVAAPRTQRGRHRCGVVRDQQVAWTQHIRQVGEPEMLDPVVSDVADQQPDLVARDASRLGRLVGLQLGWKLELERPAFNHQHRLSSLRGNRDEPLGFESAERRVLIQELHERRRDRGRTWQV